MKKTIIGMTLLTSISAIASTGILGKYDGKTEEGERCKISILKNNNTNYPYEVSIKLSKALAGSKKHTLTAEEEQITDGIKYGQINLSTLFGIGYLNYREKKIDFRIDLNSDDTLESYTVTGRRTGYYFVNSPNGSVHCYNLVKKR